MLPTADDVLAVLTHDGQSWRRITAALWLARVPKGGAALDRCESLLTFDGTEGGEVLVQLLDLQRRGLVVQTQGERGSLWRLAR